MPSAASVKLDKPPTNNSAVTVAGKEPTAAENVDNSSPIRQVIVIIDHKIRNLEKRKGKLESYRDIEKSGKELSADQKVAVSKYDEVAMTLDFAREFSKQIFQIAAVSERDLKKKQKKDETSKKQGETSKIREVLIIQDVLSQLTNEIVRKDFLAGANGACKLEESDLKILDQFHEKVTPKRPTEPNGTVFKNAAQKSADHLALTIDGKQKEFEDSTYASVKAILKNIQKCSYFDVVDQKAGPTKSAAVEVSLKDDDVNRVESETETNRSEEAFAATEDLEAKKLEFREAPAAAAVPVPTFPPQQLNANAPSVPPPQANTPVSNLPPLVQQQTILQSVGPVAQTAPGSGNLSLQQPGQPALNHPVHPAHLQPTTVRAVEQAYFKQHQYMQQIHPLTDVIGGSNFFFLQDSELDSPDLGAASVQGFQPQPQNPNGPIQVQPNVQQVPLQQQSQQQPQQQPPHIQSAPQSQIPSQTFTNQSFPNVVYANIKPQTVADPTCQQVPTIQQPQIPGFATPNAPIPIPIVQPTVAPAPAPPTSINPVTSATVLPVAGKLVSPSPIVTGGSGAAPLIIPSSNILPGKGLPSTVSMPTVESIEQRVPEISEWKPDEASHPSLKATKSKGGPNQQREKRVAAVPEDSEGNNEWREQFSYAATTANINPENNDWNGVSDENSPDESNAWSSGGNQRYQYRQNSGRYNRNNRTDGPGPGANNVRNGNNGTRNNTGNNIGHGSGTTASNGYRTGGRPNSNSSYANNGGSRNSGGGSGGPNNGTYYRNNDTYQNGGGNGNYRGDKPDNYTRPNSYRTRDSRDTRENNSANLSSYKNGSGQSGGQSLPPRNNSHSSTNNGNRSVSNNNSGAAGDIGERGHNNANSQAARPANAPNKGSSGGPRNQQTAPINA